MSGITPEAREAAGVPVVDREALAELIRKELAIIGDRSYYRAALDGIDAGIASGVLRDAADIWDEGWNAYDDWLGEPSGIDRPANPYRSTEGGTR